MLDCTDDDVESRLCQGIAYDEKLQIQFQFSATSPKDLAAINTAQELTYIHMGAPGRPGNWSARGIRVAIQTRLKAIESLVKVYIQQPSEKARARIHNELAPENPYAGVLRSHMRKLLTPQYIKAFGL